MSHDDVQVENYALLKKKIVERIYIQTYTLKVDTFHHFMLVDTVDADCNATKYLLHPKP
jgi:hypothetical protein